MVWQERSDTAVIFGKPCPHQMVAIYELDDDGLIHRWREYLDMADLTRKMGVDEQVAGYGG
jgi:limonene-1,2-epoxide hydrolase